MESILESVIVDLRGVLFFSRHELRSVTYDNESVYLN